MGGPKPVTCESESEGDDVATELPARGDDTPKKRSNSSSSTVTARQERPSEPPRKPSSRSSDSGYSTGTKGSGDAERLKRAAAARDQASMPPPEIVPPSPARKASRPPTEHKSSGSRSNDGPRSTHSAPTRMPSTKARSDSRSGTMPDHGPHARGEMAPPPPPSGDGLRRTTSQRSGHRTSPPSSRGSRAPSRASEEMPPPPLPRPRSISANRARPSSFHAGMGMPYDAYYAAYGTPYGSYERDYGPPPARSAYVDKGALGYPVRPPLSVMPAGHPAYHDPMALQRANYEQARVSAAHRAQTEYSTASTASHYSARHPVSYFPDQPNPYDASPVRSRDRSQPPSPLRERHERPPVSARQPVRTSMHEDYMFSHDLSGSEDGSGEDDEDDFEEGGKFMPRQQRPARRSFHAHLSARGMPGPHPTAMPLGYGTSPHYEMPDPYLLDDGFVSSDYRSSVRSKESAGSHSTQSRRLSVASSADRGTKATSYSASSGSGGYPRRIAGAYEQFATSAAVAAPNPLDDLTSAEHYIRQTDAKANHIRQQQPAVTQESLRQHNARAIEAKRSSRPGGAPTTTASSSSRAGGGRDGTGATSTSRRSRTITAAEEQIIRLNIDTSAGVNVELEGDTEGRPIKWVQRPGETKAQLIIGSSGGVGREGTVYGESMSRGGEQSGVSGRTGSTRGAVSGRRERARTEV